MNNLLYVDDDARDGISNMAVDDLLGRREIQADFDFILRTYYWDKPTLSCGYHQKTEKRINFDSCKMRGVGIVRRPTGGRELLHDGDLSFSITGLLGVMNDENAGGAKDYFIKAAEVIVGGLKAIGVNAQVKSGNLKSKGLESAPCLAAISQYEIVCSGKKIVPMAQRMYQEAIMVHGSIPLKNSNIQTSELLSTRRMDQLQKIIEESSTSLRRISGTEIDITKLKNGLISTFEGVFNGVINKCSISEILSEVSDIEKTKWKIKDN